jgi:hypothetical protein
MPTLDERLQQELRDATPSRDPDAVHRHVASRRRQKERRRALGRVGLTVAVLGAAVGAVILAARTDDAAIVPPTPRPADNATVVTEPHRIEGVPFEVCRSVSIPMSFGAEDEGRVLVVEEPHGDARTCEQDGGEGFQRLAVAPDGSNVIALSERLRECPDAGGCWPAATPDLDADGTDEVALGVGWRPEGWSQIVFYAVPQGEGAVRRIELRCDQTRSCPSPWVFDVSARPESTAAITCRTDGAPVLETYDTSVEGDALATYVVGTDPLAFIPLRAISDVEAPPSSTGRHWLETDASASTICGARFWDLRAADPLMADHVIDLLDQPVDEATIASDLRLCHVEQLSGLSLGAEQPLATAWTGHRMVNDRCRDAYDAPGIVAVDVNGDGSADGWTETEWCSDGCEPLAGTDLNADGRDELVVLLQWSSTPVFALFEMVPDGDPRSPGVYPIFVAPPGHAAAGFEPGEPFRLWAGGDEGFAAAFRCEGYPASPVIVAATSDQVVDGPDPARITLTRLRLGDDGALHVVEARAYEGSAGQGLPIEQEERACGVGWGL